MPTNEINDPGRTPGSAEGDLETIEQDLREKGLDDDDDSADENDRERPSKS